ncbi:MAG: DUF3881 family protein [Clostridiales bacterium]|nr:DUF3881 family protein [Clostridiales bacterium]
MHSFLKAIGFSKLKNRLEVEQLIQSVINEASQKHLLSLDNHSTLAELSLEFAPEIGITVRGEYDENKVFHLEHYFPYYRGQNISAREQIFVSKRVDTDAYTGMCDDYRLGVSLIFYLQNIIDYLHIRQDIKVPMAYPVSLVGLACEGKILLPVEKCVRNESSSKTDLRHRNQLIAEAKKGNQEAIDSLTIDDIDMYTMVSKRIKKEDVYSIVDTSFVPYGTESDNYTVLGTIMDVREVINQKSKEELFILSLECNELCFEVCINKENLFGEPSIGRRFRGTIWMQGNVDFNNGLTSM